jgi:hypothetical protein
MDEDVDLTELPSEFYDLIPLIGEWAIRADDPAPARASPASPRCFTRALATNPKAARSLGR